jgi:hypothetical protein
VASTLPIVGENALDETLGLDHDARQALSEGFSKLSMTDPRVRRGIPTPENHSHGQDRE